jgi:hypothetical protein
MFARSRRILSARLARPAVVLLVLVVASRVTNLRTSAADELNAQGGIWAVMGDESVRRQGLSDLVMAGLSQRDIKLVERDNLAQVLSEWKLERVQGPGQVRQRIEIGKALGADRLIVLSQVKSVDGRSLVKVVFCDCRLGARLRVSHITAEADAATHAVQVLEWFEETNSNYAPGVRTIYGVAPFVSKALSHDYDHLQAAYGHLLGAALARRPAVAVLEIEEATAIRREQLIGRSKGSERNVPLMISGEFRVEPPDGDAPTKIRFKVDVLNANDKIRTLRSDPLVLNDAAHWIIETASEAIHKQSSTDGLSERQVADALIARAEAFSQLGAFDHSTDLRETVLLWRPEIAAQRSQLIDEYLRIVSAPMPKEITQDEFGEPYQQTARRRWATWRRAVVHLEHLVRNRQANPAQVANLVYQVFHQERTTQRLRFGAEEDRSRAEALKKQFFATLVVPSMNLDPEYPYRGQRGHWWLTIGQVAFRRLDGQRLNRDDLDLWCELYERQLPAGYDLRRGFSWREEDFARSGKTFDFSKQEYLEFLEKLAQSTRSENAYTGRVGLLCYRKSAAGKSAEAARALLADLDLLLAEMKAETAANPSLSGKRRDMRELVERTRKDVKLQLTRLEGRGKTTDAHDAQSTAAAIQARVDVELQDLQAQLNTVAANLAAVRSQLARHQKLVESNVSDASNLKRLEAQVAQIEADRRQLLERIAALSGGGASKRPPEPSHEVKYQEVALRLLDATGKTGSLNLDDRQGRFGLHLLPCRQMKDAVNGPGDFDVLWGSQSVLASHTPGLFREIATADQYLFEDVQWDGRLLWIATREGELRVVTPTGTVVTNVDRRAGLPETDRGVRLHTVEQGAVCAVGSFGPHHRGWCAMVRLVGPGDNQPAVGRVNVFHEATRVQRSPEEKELVDANLAFYPVWLHAHRSPDGDTETLLVGRRGRYVQSWRHPLAINLRTLDVGVAAARLPVYLHRNAVASVDDTILFATSRGPVTVAWGPALQDAAADTRQLAQVDANYRQEDTLLRWRGKLYTPGKPWFQIDPATMQVDALKSAARPGFPMLNRFGGSVHYGIAGWGRRFYQITIGEKP